MWATAYGSVGKAFPKGELHVWGQNNYLQLGKTNHFNQVLLSMNIVVSFAGIKTKEVDIFRPKVSKTFPSKEKSWKKLIGEHHVLALDESGNVWGIGRGDDHKLGQGDDVTNKDSLVKIEIPNGGKVIDIAASQATSVVATEAGKNKFKWKMWIVVIMASYFQVSLLGDSTPIRNWGWVLMLTRLRFLLKWNRSIWTVILSLMCPLAGNTWY